MKRTTVKVDDEIDARIRQEAMRRGLTVSEWVREAVLSHLPGDTAVGGQCRSFRAAGAGASGRSDISVRIDEFLAGMEAAESLDGKPRTERIG